jgi:hypothetical protein
MVAVTRQVNRLLVDQHGVDDAAHLDSCCQTRLLQAKREISRAATAPTLPRTASATIRSKSARVTPPAAGH